eukprot:GHVQ01025471.1.p1 GENE.GHVQ01025471.1~~GHVQ01025471.1.p1  ORF type:complete len:387 (+),score=75.48 GHVQ01025471.1:661-1821(+)
MPSTDTAMDTASSLSEDSSSNALAAPPSTGHLPNNAKAYSIPPAHPTLWKTFGRHSAAGRVLSALYQTPQSRRPLREQRDMYPKPKSIHNSDVYNVNYLNIIRQGGSHVIGGGSKGSGSVRKDREASVVVPRLGGSMNFHHDGSNLKYQCYSKQRKSFSTILQDTDNYKEQIAPPSVGNDGSMTAEGEVIDICDLRKADLQHLFRYQSCQVMPTDARLPAPTKDSIPLQPSKQMEKKTQLIQQTKNNPEQSKMLLNMIKKKHPRTITTTTTGMTKENEKLFRELVDEIDERQAHLTELQSQYPTETALKAAAVSALAEDAVCHSRHERSSKRGGHGSPAASGHMTAGGSNAVSNMNDNLNTELVLEKEIAQRMKDIQLIMSVENIS